MTNNNFNTIMIWPDCVSVITDSKQREKTDFELLRM